MESRLTRAAAEHLAIKINRYAQKEGIELEKMILGAEILLINVSKIVIIYSLAVWLGILTQTFVTHAAFALIKRYSFGLHALNSTVCTLVSCIMFVGIPLLLYGVHINNYTVAAVFAAVVLVLYQYAPADTKARPLIGARLRAQLKVRAVVCGMVLAAIALIIPSETIKLSLVLGAVYQSMSVLPLTYKILKRSEKNYESYEFS